jgi:hypothetical protein
MNEMKVVEAIHELEVRHEQRLTIPRASAVG